MNFSTKTPALPNTLSASPCVDSSASRKADALRTCAYALTATPMNGFDQYGKACVGKRIRTLGVMPKTLDKHLFKPCRKGAADPHGYHGTQEHRVNWRLQVKMRQ